MSELHTAIFHNEIPEDTKEMAEVHIFGDFTTLSGDFLQNVCMTCFWGEHGYEYETKEGWLVSIAEGIWCVEARGWIEVK